MSFKIFCSRFFFWGTPPLPTYSFEQHIPYGGSHLTTYSSKISKNFQNFPLFSKIEKNYSPSYDSTKIKFEKVFDDLYALWDLTR